LLQTVSRIEKDDRMPARDRHNAPNTFRGFGNGGLCIYCL
jgi:hypothetical protein